MSPDRNGSALLEFVRRVETETFAKCVDVFDVDEWRVAFAGQLYPRNSKPKYRGPWSQARLLMEEPFEIVTCVGLPRNGLEQLCVRLPAVYSEEKYGSTAILESDSREVLDELLSIISLLTTVRLRIIALAATYLAPAHLRQDIGDPRVRHMDRVIGARMPQALFGKLDDETQEAEAYCDLDGEAFGGFLRALSNDPCGDAFVSAARAFTSALDLQETRPEIAYVLLVSSVESMARIAYEGWTPTLEEMRKAREALVSELQSTSLTDAQAESILVASCKGNPWVGRKFQRYLVEHLPGAVVCPKLPYLQIEPDNIQAVAQTIYRARSTMMHDAGALPPTASYAGGQWVPIRSFAAMMDASTTSGWAPSKVPPVNWFLRAVATAHRSFICKRLGIERCPAGECTEDDMVSETP